MLAKYIAVILRCSPPLAASLEGGPQAKRTAARAAVLRGSLRSHLRMTMEL
jgi:hypothetical protein